MLPPRIRDRSGTVRGTGCRADPSEQASGVSARGVTERRGTEGAFRREGEWRAGELGPSCGGCPTKQALAWGHYLPVSECAASRRDPPLKRAVPLPCAAATTLAQIGAISGLQRGFPFLSLHVSLRHRRIPGVTPMTPSLSRSHINLHFSLASTLCLRSRPPSHVPLALWLSSSFCPC